MDNSYSHRITCERCIFPPPTEKWYDSDPDWIWSEYICEGSAIGNPAGFKRSHWAVAYGKVICPGCLAALVREEAPTQQEYAEWAKKVAANPKPKRKVKKKPKTKVPEVALSAPRGLDLSD